MGATWSIGSRHLLSIAELPIVADVWRLASSAGVLFIRISKPQIKTTSTSLTQTGIWSDRFTLGATWSLASNLICMTPASTAGFRLPVWMVASCVTTP